MNARRLLFIVGFLVAIAAAFAAGAWAQTKKTVWHWSDSLDAVNAAPKNHKVLFENDHVLLLEVTIQPGETENMHGHKWPSIFAFDAVQPKLSDHKLEGDTHNLVDRRYEDADWSAPQCRTMSIQAPHQVTDLDPFPLHFYRLEFKKMDGKSIKSMPGYHD